MGDHREPAGYKPGGQRSQFGHGFALTGGFYKVVCVLVLVEHVVACYRKCFDFARVGWHLSSD